MLSPKIQDPASFLLWHHWRGWTLLAYAQDGCQCTCLAVEFQTKLLTLRKEVFQLSQSFKGCPSSSTQGLPLRSHWQELCHITYCEGGWKKIDFSPRHIEVPNNIRLLLVRTPEVACSAVCYSFDLHSTGDRYSAKPTRQCNAAGMSSKVI